MEEEPCKTTILEIYLNSNDWSHMFKCWYVQYNIMYSTQFSLIMYSTVYM